MFLKAFQRRSDRMGKEPEIRSLWEHLKKLLFFIFIFFLHTHVYIFYRIERIILVSCFIFLFWFGHTQWHCGEKAMATHFSTVAWKIPWWAAVHEVAKSQTWLSKWTHTHTHTHTHTQTDWVTIQRNGTGFFLEMGWHLGCQNDWIWQNFCGQKIN